MSTEDPYCYIAWEADSTAEIYYTNEDTSHKELLRSIQESHPLLDVLEEIPNKSKLDLILSLDIYKDYTFMGLE